MTFIICEYDLAEDVLIDTGFYFTDFCLTNYTLRYASDFLFIFFLNGCTFALSKNTFTFKNQTLTIVIKLIPYFATFLSSMAHP